MSCLELFLLGSYQIKLDHQPITGIKTDKARALLAYLAEERKRSHRRQVLAGLLWPDFPESSARESLRHALANLRQVLGDEHNPNPFILVDGDTLQFNPLSDFWLDVAVFEGLAASTSDISSSSGATLEILESAIFLYHGSFLEGFTLKDSPDFDNWTYVLRERYQGIASTILEKLANGYEQSKAFEKAIGYTKHRLELEPWQEEAYCKLMKLLALSGQCLAAMLQFEVCKRSLKDELGIEPSAKTIQLYESIRDGKIAAAQLEKARLHNLPAPLTSFIGREKEIEQVKALLVGSKSDSRSYPSTRLVTLTGAGGTGKTRLALEVAGRVLGIFPDGIWLVELGPLTDPAIVTQNVANVLGMQLASNPQALSFLEDYLQNKYLLLLLDNCEHLIEACARLAYSLLKACPRLVILATSREALGIEGETFYSVPPLAFPDANELPSPGKQEEYAAIRLFVERAEAVSPSFQINAENTPAIIKICQRLDGIPLAIELAAARVKILHVGEIAERLDNRFKLLIGGSRAALPRYQTLRASIEWSYELLSPAERALLQRLSVFAGNWVLEAAECVGCGEGIDSCDVLDLLSQLVNKSLVSIVEGNGTETRYRMLETIRQFAHEKLVESSNEKQACLHHLEYYRDLTEELESKMHGACQVVTRDCLEAELDNIRLALRWCLEYRRGVNWNPEPGLCLASALNDYWYFCGRLAEGFQWLEQLLAAEVEQRNGGSLTPERAKWRAKALQVAGNLAIYLRENDKALEFSEESRDLFLELGSEGRRGYALALENLAWLGVNGNCKYQVRELIEECIAIFKEVGDEIQEAECHMCLGCMTFTNFDLDQAKTYFEEALTFWKKIGDKEEAANMLLSLGEINFLQGDFKKAKILYKESQILFVEVKSKFQLGVLLQKIGMFECTQGNYDQASRSFEAALDLGRCQGDVTSICSSISSLGGLALLQRDYNRASEWFEENLAYMRKNDYPGLVASSLGNLGYLAWETGDYQQAEQRYSEKLDMDRKSGNKYFQGDALFGLGRVVLTQGGCDRARKYLMESLEIRQAILVREIPPIIEAFAYLEIAQENQSRAARLLGASQSWHAFNHFNRSTKEHEMRKNAISSLKQALGEEAFAATWAEGQAMTLEQVIAYAKQQ